MTALGSLNPVSTITAPATINVGVAGSSLYYVPQSTPYQIVSNGTVPYSWGTVISGSTTSTTITIDDAFGGYGVLPPHLPIVDGKVEVPLGTARDLVLPDGTVIAVDAQGNFKIRDAAAKVIYQANRMREFNPFINASDQLARFIEFVGGLGIRRDEVGKLPVALFVNWLVVEAARADGDVVPEDVVPPEKHRLLTATTHPRCLLARCRRFIPRALASGGFLFCNPRHAGAHFRMLGA